MEQMINLIYYFIYEPYYGTYKKLGNISTFTRVYKKTFKHRAKYS